MSRTPLRLCLLFGLMALMTVRPASGDDRARRDVEYLRRGERSLKLDFYPAAAIEPAPVVVWVHGGAWRSGSKADVPVKSWLKQGLSIASVDYRLSPEAPFPAQVHDIKAAIRFLRAHAREFSIDPARVIVAGSSAGGHLAALVGVSNGVAELEDETMIQASQQAEVRAVVSFYGGSNLQTILSQSTPHGLSVRVPALNLLLGGTPDEKPELARLASPVAHVDASDPPLWLIHGDADPQMPIEQSRELAAKYRELGRPVDFEVIPGGKHGGAEFFEEGRLERLAAKLKESLKTGGSR